MVDINHPGLRPIPPSSFQWQDLPPSQSPDDVVRVSMIPSSGVEGPTNMFIDIPEDKSRLCVPSFSFLIEHKRSGKALLWDLGVTKDKERLTPALRDRIFKLFDIVPDKDVMARLAEGNFDMSTIDALVLSHHHFDHIGDISTLPPHAKVICGPGTLQAMQPGYPEDESSPWWSKWFEEHEFLELPSTEIMEKWEGPIAEFATSKKAARKWQKVACYEHAVDWFGDGSLWFVDTPGHCVGHISALARVTSDPDTYVFLAGDTSHHQTLYLPVPVDGQPDHRTKLPFYPKPDGSGEMTTMDEDPLVNTQNVGRLTRLSAEENIMVILAHEGEVEGVLPIWPRDICQWKTQGWKEEKEKSLRANIARASTAGTCLGSVGE